MHARAFHHVGIACVEVDADERLFAALGYHRERADVTDPLQNVWARFMVGGGPRIELLGDLRGAAIVQSAQKGRRLHHLAYEVDDLDITSSEFRDLGAKEVAARRPGVAFDMRDICFWMLPNMMLIELISKR